MALAALCRDDEWGRTWADVLQHRFESDGELHSHAVGNLLIVALWELLGGPIEGLEWVARLLGAQGRVLPMADVPLDIQASVRGVDPARPSELSTVRGQVEVATTPGMVESVELLPADPPVCAEASRRSIEPTGSCSVPALGTQACCHICSCPSCGPL